MGLTYWLCSATVYFYKSECKYTALFYICKTFWLKILFFPLFYSELGFLRLFLWVLFLVSLLIIVLFCVYVR